MQSEFVDAAMPVAHCARLSRSNLLQFFKGVLQCSSPGLSIASMLKSESSLFSPRIYGFSISSFSNWLRNRIVAMCSRKDLRHGPKFQKRVRARHAVLRNFASKRSLRDQPMEKSR